MPYCTRFPSHISFSPLQRHPYGHNEQCRRYRVPQVVEIVVLDVVRRLQVRPGHVGREPHILVPEPLGPATGDGVHGEGRAQDGHVADVVVDVAAASLSLPPVM